MKTLLSLFIFLCLSAALKAQSTQTKYFKDKYLSKEVSATKAKFAQSITHNEDGSVTDEVRDLKNDIVIRRENTKGEEPVGVWLVRVGNTVKEINYDFELKYGSYKCKDSIASKLIKDPMRDNDSVGYKAPKIASGEATVMQYIQHNLQFPRRAREEAIQGNVHLQFIVRKDGSIDNCTIIKGAHVILDKESLRAIRELRFSNPATLNGEPQSFCLHLPINFRVQ